MTFTTRDLEITYPVRLLFKSCYARLPCIGRRGFMLQNLDSPEKDSLVTRINTCSFSEL